MKRVRSSGEFDRVVVTGLSGAGKTVVLRALEDLGYFCVDNLPLELLPSLIQLYRRWGRSLSRVAVGVDVRTGLPAGALARSLERFKKEALSARVLFLDSDNATLQRRFSETRRRHPLNGTVSAGIRRERTALREVKALADKVIDTSHLTPGEVKEVVVKTLGLRHAKRMSVAVMSFGYKYGVPVDADLMWDVRFLPNPNWVAALRPLDGRKPSVAKYVMGNPLTKSFMAKLEDILSLLLGAFSREGKSYLTIAVGCTGGRHRSVAITEALGRFIRARRRGDVRVVHRDLGAQTVMIGILIVTHGRMGEELLKVAEGIIGRQSGVKVLGLEGNEGPVALEGRLLKALEELGSEAGVLLLTDMLGGTPCNVGLKQLRDPRFHYDVVTGVNLPMIISAITNRHYMPLAQLAQKLVDDAGRNIVRPLQKLQGGA